MLRFSGLAVAGLQCRIGLWLLAAAESGGLLRRALRWMEAFAARPAASAWLFVFAFAESSFFPIPPDVLLIALCLTEASLSSVQTAMWYAAVCTAGSALGGAFGYYLGAKAGRPILARIARSRTVDAAEGLLQRYDVWAVGAAGFTPIPYKVFTIASGLLRVRFARFVVVSVASRGARFFLVAALCHALGEGVRYYLDRHFWWATAALFAGLVLGFLAVGTLLRRLRPGDGTVVAGGDEAEAKGDAAEDPGAGHDGPERPAERT